MTIEYVWACLWCKLNLNIADLYLTNKGRKQQALYDSFHLPELDCVSHHAGFQKGRGNINTLNHKRNAPDAEEMCGAGKLCHATSDFTQVMLIALLTWLAAVV